MRFPPWQNVIANLSLRLVLPAPHHSWCYADESAGREANLTAVITHSQTIKAAMADERSYDTESGPLYENATLQ